MTNIRSCNVPVQMADGSTTNVTLRADHELAGNTLIIENAPLNIASLYELWKQFHITFDDATNTYEFRNRTTLALEYIAPCQDRMYPIQKVDSSRNLSPGLDLVMASLIKDYPIVDLHTRLAHHNFLNIAKSLKLGHYQDIGNVQLSNADDQRCITCLETNDHLLAGTDRKRKTSSSNSDTRMKRVKEDPKTDELLVEDHHSQKSPSFGVPQVVEVTGDVVYFEDDARYELLFRVIELDFRLTTSLPSRSTDDLITKCRQLVNEIQSARGILKISNIYFDNEPALVSDPDRFLLEVGVPLENSIPHRHNASIENSVRDLRNKHRAILADWPIHENQSIRRLAWTHAVQTSNFIMTERTNPYLPIQMFYAELNYWTPYKFGTFVYASVGQVTSKLDDRRAIGLIVGFPIRSRGAWIWFKGARKPVLRDSFIPVTDQQGIKQYKKSIVSPEDEEDEEEAAAVDSGDDDQNHEPRPQRSRRLPAYLQDYVMSILSPSDKPQKLPKSRKKRQRVKRFLDLVCAARHGLPDPDPIEEPIHITLERIFATLQIQGEDWIERKKAAKAEIEKVYLKYHTFEPVRLTTEEIKQQKPIRGMLFTTPRVKQGKTEYKGRLVARGDQRTTETDTFSPNCAFASLMLCLNIALEKKLDYQVLDVESAYLNAEAPEGVYMQLDGEILQILKELDPNISEFITTDGKLFVKLIKALYGLQESAKKWHEELTSTLKSLKFEKTPNDHSVFYRRYKVAGKEKLAIILVYVDDLLVIGDVDELNRIHNGLKAKYGIKGTEISPKEFEYLQIKIEHDEVENAFLVSQVSYLKKITEDTVEMSSMPYDANLFKTSDEAELLENVTEYRSVVMELAYITRSRPDIKTPVGFLVTRMQSPTTEDLRKAHKVLSYLKGTSDFKLRLKPESGALISGSADASFGIYQDTGRSNTGVHLTVFGEDNAPVYAKSGVQKSVANSSSAAELIAFATALEEALWIREMMATFGYDVESNPIEIGQDNQSTISLIKKGPSSGGRLKWLNIKNFWITEHVSEGHVKVDYVPSLEILSDGFTKPLNQKQFKIWRSRVLNSKKRER